MNSTLKQGPWTVEDRRTLAREWEVGSRVSDIARLLRRAKADVYAEAERLHFGPLPKARSHTTGCSTIPALPPEPGCPRQEARRARARQMAEILIAGPATRRGLTTRILAARMPGYTVMTHEAIDALLAESPEWFSETHGVVSLLAAGRETLLPGRVA